MGEITQLLDLTRQGDPAARERFFAHIYSELDGLARRHLGRPERFTMLDAPALVHEVYLRLAQQAQMPGRDRRAFLAYASRIMRSVVIDYVRTRKAERHGGGREMITLNTGIGGLALQEPNLLALGDALESLQRIDDRAHWVVEMRYFGGMEVEEIAEFLGISPATVKRDWQKARAFLLQSLRSGRDPA
jgi:RNA polymerase sigma factor (TIGR02999 family)